MTKPTPKARLRACLKHLPDLSLRALDRLAGTPAGYSAGIAAGTRPNPGKGIAERIAPVLGVSWAWLLGADGAEPTRESVRAAVEAARHGVKVSPSGNGGKKSKRAA
jgi:transcriptional regulator with XRE-family HTH domain